MEGRYRTDLIVRQGTPWHLRPLLCITISFYRHNGLTIAQRGVLVPRSASSLRVHARRICCSSHLRWDQGPCTIHQPPICPRGATHEPGSQGLGQQPASQHAKSPPADSEIVTCGSLCPVVLSPSLSPPGELHHSAAGRRRPAPTTTSISTSLTISSTARSVRRHRRLPT